MFDDRVESYESLSEGAKSVLSEEAFQKAYKPVIDGRGEVKAYELRLNKIGDHSLARREKEKWKAEFEKSARSEEESKRHDLVDKASVESVGDDSKRFEDLDAKIKAMGEAAEEKARKIYSGLVMKSLGGFAFSKLGREIAESSIGKKEWVLEGDAFVVAKGADAGKNLDQVIEEMRQNRPELFVSSENSPGDSPKTKTVPKGATKAKLRSVKGARAKFLREFGEDAYLNLPEGD